MEKILQTQVHDYFAQKGCYIVVPLLWDSFDNQVDGGVTDFFTKPLGPVIDGRNNRAAFRHAGGEVIFHLPNRLLAFYLATDTGIRIDEGPINIVRDPQQFSGTNAIVNGISCMGATAKVLLNLPTRSEKAFCGLRGSPSPTKSVCQPP